LSFPCEFSKLTDELKSEKMFWVWRKKGLKEKGEKQESLIFQTIELK